MTREVLRTDYIINRLSTDITHHCNLRCKFCLHVGSDFDEPWNMDLQTFEKILSLLDYTHDESYLFACMWESTIHPRFAEYLALIPSRHARKGYFTTNLAKRLSDQDIRAMAEANLAYINFSLQSLDPAVCDALGQSRGLLARITDNLERISRAFSEAPHPPEIRFISMILRDNWQGLPALARECSRKYGATSHEFRTPYPHAQRTDPAYISQLLSPQELESLHRDLQAEGLPICFFGDNSTEGKPSQAHSIQPGELNIGPPGRLLFAYSRETFELRDLDNPIALVRDKINGFKKELAPQPLTGLDISQVSVTAPLHLHFDCVNSASGFFSFSGWVALPGMNTDRFYKVFFVTSRETGQTGYFKLDGRGQSRPDVCKTLGLNQSSVYSFQVYLPEEFIVGDTFSAGVFFKYGDTILRAEHEFYRHARALRSENIPEEIS